MHSCSCLCASATALGSCLPPASPRDSQSLGDEGPGRGNCLDVNSGSTTKEMCVCAQAS